MAVLVKNEMQYVDKFLFWINYFQVTEEFYLTDFLIFFFVVSVLLNISTMWLFEISALKFLNVHKS